MAALQPAEAVELATAAARAEVHCGTASPHRTKRPWAACGRPPPLAGPQVSGVREQDRYESSLFADRRERERGARARARKSESEKATVDQQREMR